MTNSMDEHDEWLYQMAQIYRGSALDELLKELFPVEVGVKALQDRRDKRMRNIAKYDTNNEEA